MEVFSKSTASLLVRVITDAIKPHVVVLLRPLIKPAVGIGINVSNKFLGKFIPDEIDPLLNSAIQKANEGEWDSAAEDIGLAGNMLVDIPNVDDEHERKLFVSIAQAIVNGVKSWIENKKK